MPQRPKMMHGGRRAGRWPARPILAPPYAILPHPDRKGYWVVTHWTVLAIACPECGSERDELCQDIYSKPNGRYSSGIHYARRLGNTQHARDKMHEVLARRDVKVPPGTWERALMEEA